MLVALSPYHLTTREQPAMAALLLGTRVVTLMPTPFGAETPERISEVVERVPRYFDFMRSWAWAMPLWDAAVISSVLDGQDAADDVRAVWRRLQRDPRLEDLRGLMKPELFDDEEAYLDAMARDLLRGGPDPGVSVPVAAGLDRFSVRMGCLVARPEPVSVAQHAEARDLRRSLVVVLPVFFQAGAETILEAREILQPELEPLRRAISDAAGAAVHQEEDGDAAERVRRCAAAFGAAFEECVRELAAWQEDDEPRMVHGQATLTLASLPVDAVLDSSLAAMKVLAPQSRGGVATAVDTALPAEHDPLAGRRFATMTVRPIGRVTGRRHV